MLVLRPSSLCIALVTTLATACTPDPTPNDTLADTGTGESDSATTTDDEASSSDATESSADTDTADTTETAGSGLCEGECGTPNCGECPQSPSVAVPGGFSIGATEVRNGDYVLLLDVVFEPAFFAGWLPAECDWKTDFTPANGVPNESENLPVTRVDWCDAWAYCSWSGQHLCGAIGGGPLPEVDLNDPGVAEWHTACTADGLNAFPYGNDYDPGACNGADSAFEQRLNVGSLPACQGGYPGVFDLSGNVWEWENSCIPDPLLAPQDQLCQERGGSYFSTVNSLRCGSDTPKARNHRNVNLGIRCCDMP